MHDGTSPYEGVIHTVQQLLQKNGNDNSNDNSNDNDNNNRKKLIILSNSSKRLNNAKKMLTKLGFDAESDFVQIITSGDISHRMLSGEGSSSLGCSTWDVLDALNACNDENGDKKKNKVFVFGSGDGDEEYITSCGWTLCTDVEEANLIVARGTFTIYTNGNGNGNGNGNANADADANEVVVVSKKDNEEIYNAVLEETLEKASKLKNPVPMLVTNPDKVRPDEGLPPMPGAIGDAYEKYLNLNFGEDDKEKKKPGYHPLVKRIGKPYPEVYDIALSFCDAVDRSKVIMVGDALETDITGGMRSNIDTLWVVDDGIHSPFVEERMKDGGAEYEGCVEAILDEFNDKKNYTGEERLRPTFVTKHFQW